jgi:uncharacterized membrane protein
MGIFLKKYKHELVLGILICFYVAYFTVATFLKYDNFYAGRYDLGNMDQTVWNTTQGRFFQTSDDNGNTISRLAYHADFMLVLLSPFYFIWNNPKTLLSIQTVVMGLGGLFVYLISKEVLKNKNLSLIFSLLFLINPMVQYANLYDFHSVTLSTTFLLASFYYLIRKRYFLMTIFLFLSGITKEQVWAIVSLFGFPLLFQKLKSVKLLGVGIIVFSLVIFYYLVSFAIPHSLGRQHFALAYYSDFGNSPVQVISKILISPQNTLPIIFEANRIGYLAYLFVPLGFLSLLSPAFLIFATPDLLINLLSNNPGLRQIYYQYTTTITPFIFISSIFAVKNIRRWFPKIPNKAIAIYLLLFGFISAYSFGPLPGAKHPSIDMFTKPQKNKIAIENLLVKIPEKYKVAATNNLGAHLSHREIIYTIPVGVDKADIILFLLNDRFAKPSLKAQRELTDNLKQNKNYIKIFEKDNFVAFKKQGIVL